MAEKQPMIVVEVPPLADATPEEIDEIAEQIADEAVADVEPEDE